MSLCIDLSGRRALVTGAGRGIGRGIALALAECGADVALNARTTAQLQQTAAAIEKMGRRAVVIPADLSEPAAARAVVEQAHAELGGLSILAYAAGIERHQPTLETSDRDSAAVLELNLGAAFRACREAGRLMIPAGGGRILLVASVGAFVAMARNAPYHASKAGLVLLAKSLAVEWARHNITVNALCPGYVQTEMLDSLLGDDERKAKFARAIPLRRFADPSEMGRLAAVLVSDLAAYVTGEALVADGGLSAS